MWCGRLGFFCVLAAALIALPGAALRAQAESTTSFTNEAVTVRLFPAGPMQAGLHIVLQPGWKTYWRHPGDSGISPLFDWSGSHNAKRVAVDWPLPRRSSDAAGSINAYSGELVLPIRFDTNATAGPADLRLAMFLGICSTLCVPVRADLSLPLGPPRPTDAALLVRFASNVPRVIDLPSAPDGRTSTLRRLGIDALQTPSKNLPDTLAHALRTPIPPELLIVRMDPRSHPLSDVFVEDAAGEFRFLAAQPIPGGAELHIFEARAEPCGSATCAPVRISWQRNEREATELRLSARPRHTHSLRGVPARAYFHRE